MVHDLDTEAATYHTCILLGLKPRALRETRESSESSALASFDILPFSQSMSGVTLTASQKITVIEPQMA